MLHICPNAYGGAACFLLGDRALDLAYVHPEQQRRLLRLFYTGRHKRLAGLFERNLVDPAWPQALHELGGIAKVIAFVAAGFTALITALFFVLDLSSGKSVVAALAHMLESLPFLLWLQFLLVVITTGVVAVIAGAIVLLQWAGYTFEIEGRDFTGNLAIAGVTIVFFTLLAAWSGKWTEFPIHVASILCFFGMFMWPLFVMSRYRRQQDRLLKRIRAHYVYALTLLTGGDEAEARQKLSTIRKLEKHWHLGASPVIRYAHIAYAAVTNLCIAFPGQVFHYHTNSHHSPASFGDTVRYMLETPSVLAITLGVCAFFTLFALPDAMRVLGAAWSEFYGDKLEAALKAGRGVERAEHHDLPPLPTGVTARELLGLSPGFTKAQLRAAWLRLARELHPDRWSAAGPAVRKMKEAALQRVNAARDELAPQAL